MKTIEVIEKFHDAFINDTNWRIKEDSPEWVYKAVRAGQGML